MSYTLKKEKKEISKEIYFMILYKIEQKKLPNFKKTDIIPEKILLKEFKGEDGANFYLIVFKSNIKDHSSKKSIFYSLELEIGEQSYLASFEVKENCFVYDVELIKTIKILINFTKEKIDQNIIHYGKKLNYFLDALKENNEECKIEKLYKDTILLYSIKKTFSLLIPLFVQIYNNKELCSILMEKFKEMNNKIKEDFYNKDRKKDLGQYKKSFQQISSEADILIKNNDYEPIQFYGIILCYLNYYDYENFLKIKNKFYEENIEVLFEILILYFSHFLNPINENKNFFVKFISYTISKNEFYNFINGLNMIKDLETLIIVIEKTKRQIINKYVNSFNSSQNTFYPIKIKDNIKLIKKEKNKEMDIILPAIESIINFSKEEKVLLVYFTSNFWQQFLEDYKKPTDINIYNCYKLRELLINYKDLINELFNSDKKSIIRKDINHFCDEDDLAKLLDKNIKKYLEIYNKELSNAEILGFFEGFNPYYKEEKYYNKRELYIFDYINFNDNNEQFIKSFKKLQFEKIFLDKFSDIMISKIKDINTFGIILDLINTANISKFNSFFIQLNDKYEKIIKKQIESLTGDELKEGINIISKFFELKFIRDKNCNL